MTVSCLPKDKKCANLVLAMKSFNAYFSCWHCLIPGKKEGNKTMVFPSGPGDQFARRTLDFMRHCLSVKEEKGYKYYCGHISDSPFFNLPTLDPFFIIVPEAFHNIPLGVVMYELI